MPLIKIVRTMSWSHVSINAAAHDQALGGRLSLSMH